jgi:hypothetical protein
MLSHVQQREDLRIPEHASLEGLIEGASYAIEAGGRELQRGRREGEPLN